MTTVQLRFAQLPKILLPSSLLGIVEENSMSQLIEVKVPDIGDFKDVPVIEILVKVGDTVKAEDSLVTLESDKATMDVPSPARWVWSRKSRSRSATPSVKAA